MFPGSVEITHRLAETAPDRVDMYRAALSFHFALWRWQRISDPASLAFLRRLLVENDLVEMNPSPAWIVNRNFKDYTRLLALGPDEQSKLLRNALNGHVSSRNPTRYFDIGSGNNTAAYEMTRASFSVAGSGFSLVFAFDQTLRNYLYEPFRSVRIDSYRSELAGSVLKQAEIWTVNRFLSDNFETDNFNPITRLEDGLLEGVINASVCSSVSRETKVFLDSNRPSNLDGEAVIAAIALGYLIDALSSRVRFPNGMDFTYSDIKLSAEVIPIVLNHLRDPANQSQSAKDLLSQKDRLEDLRKRIFQHLEDTSAPPDRDLELTVFLPTLADLFKSVGFELRTNNADVALIETMHVIGNELWRWHFFLQDLPAWNKTTDGSRTSLAGAAIVRAWIERPWGVLRIDDMKSALAEGFESAFADGYPPLVAGIQALLRGGVDYLIKDRFAAIPNTQARLNWLIGQRCRLRDLRESMSSITHENQSDELAAARNLADLLIELLTLWFYRQAETTQRKIVKDKFKPLIDIMCNGSWVEECLGIQEIPLTRGHLKLLDSYRRDPSRVIEDLFDFEDSDGLWDRLDVFPLEEFWLIPSNWDEVEANEPA